MERPNGHSFEPVINITEELEEVGPGNFGFESMSASPVAYSCFLLATLPEPENVPGVAVRDGQANAVVVDRKAHGVDHALESFPHDHLSPIIGFN
eukprot:10608702-Prorocentrum_lima.AAC.1